MVADSALPVWSIRPNWKNGITETLEWLSDVLRNTYGAEQVRALRLSPRRTFEATFNPIGPERAFFDLWLARLSSDEFMLPLWHDAALLTADIAAGATVIPFDTSFREFEVGGLALLAGPDAFTFDKVTITAITANSITVTAGGVTRAWSAGSSIHPLRRARLEDQSAAAAITNVVGEAALRFELNQSNDIADEGTWDTLYGGYPVILEEPNRRENLKLTFDRETVLVDNDVGLRELSDDAGRAFTLQTHLMMLVGREEQWAFRQMLYRLRGQQGAVWLPTFNADLELSRDRLAADALLDVKSVGYAYTGGVVDGRQHVLINGAITRNITAVGGAPSAAEERLVLDSALGVDVPTGTTASFMDTARLASDNIQIQHITDSDGVAEATLSFRSFRDVRTAPDPINYPIPATAMSSTFCGTPADQPCVPAIPESGFWGKLVVHTNLGPNYPVIAPWSWSVELRKVGVQQAGLLNSDALYSEYDGGGPDPWTTPYNYLLGWTTTFRDPQYATDPFIDGDPDELILHIQWPYNNYIFPGGSVFGDGLGTMSLEFHRANGAIINFGTVPIYGLWPATFTQAAL